MANTFHEFSLCPVSQGSKWQSWDEGFFGGIPAHISFWGAASFSLCLKPPEHPVEAPQDGMVLLVLSRCLWGGRGWAKFGVSQGYAALGAGR